MTSSGSPSFSLCHLLFSYRYVFFRPTTTVQLFDDTIQQTFMSEWLKAEEVDWTQVLRSYTKKARTENDFIMQTQQEAYFQETCTEFQPLRSVEVSSSKRDIVVEKLEEDYIQKLLTNEPLEFHEDIAQRMFELACDQLKTAGSVSREIVDSCKPLFELSPSSGLNAFLLPLVRVADKCSCELAERVFNKSLINSSDYIIQGLSNTNSFQNEHTLLFLQRTILLHPLSPQSLDRLITDLDLVPSNSRLAGVVFTLVKSNGKVICQYFSTLLGILNRSSGVMVGPAKKMIAQLMSES